jgi:hypothetical protein
MDSENTQRQSPPASTKPIKPRKFRSSCDACSASKVKCDQGQPQCLRCINLGLRCNYSPSRRMGKPPASSRKLTNASQLSTSSKASNTSSSDTEQSNPAKKRQLSPPSYIASPPLNEKDKPTFESSLMETDDFMAINWQDDLFQASTFDVPATADIQLGNQNIFDLNFDFIGDNNVPLPPHNQFIFGDDSSSMDSSRVPSRAPSRDPLFEPFQGFPPTMHSSPSVSSVSPRSAGSSHIKPKLCTHNLDLGNISTPSPITHTDGSIDQVLIKNKAAIEKADALLACSCSSNPHFALTLALTCIKILGTYEDIIKAVPASAISPISGRRRSGSPIQISVGAYKMDAEDEERMRIQIVVNELRKVRTLVDKYAKKYCTAGPDSNGDGIYSALEVFLRSKLKNTLHDLVTKLEC